MVGSRPHFCRSSPTDFILMRLKAGFLWTGDGALLVLLHRTSAVLVIRSRAVYLDQSVGMNPFQQLHEQILADILLNTGNLNRKLPHDLLDGSMAVANPESTGNPIRDHFQRLTALRDFTGHIEIMAADPLWFGPMPQRINDSLNVARQLDHAGSLLSIRNVGPP